jgi:hypothetical protein
MKVCTCVRTPDGGARPSGSSSTARTLSSVLDLAPSVCFVSLRGVRKAGAHLVSSYKRKGKRKLATRPTTQQF